MGSMSYVHGLVVFQFTLDLDLSLVTAATLEHITPQPRFVQARGVPQPRTPQSPLPLAGAVIAVLAQLVNRRDYLRPVERERSAVLKAYFAERLGGIA